MANGSGRRTGKRGGTRVIGSQTGSGRRASSRGRGKRLY